jgi:hypothetical protein
MATESEDKAVKTTSSRSDKKCRVEGCKRPYRAKEYCIMHYRLWRHGELPNGRYKICTKEGCKKPRVGPSGSVCAEHAAGAEKPAASA